jgi:CheY-like chemotaxis protein
VSTPYKTRRILVIDDSEAIHMDFRRILCPEQSKSRNDLDLLEEALFGSAADGPPPASEPVFEVESAFQGQEGVAKVQATMAAGRPYDLAFLDYRMPPGWNGVQTLRHLRVVAPSLRVVFCSAYSDYSWETILQELGTSQLLTELRKPFNSQQLRQLALSLTERGGGSPAPA